MQRPYSASQRLEKFRLFRYSYRSSAVLKRQLSKMGEMKNAQGTSVRVALWPARHT